MYRNKHQKKQTHWFHFVFILFFVGLIVVESYLLLSQQSTTHESLKKGVSTQPADRVAIDARNAVNFNQAIAPTTPLAKKIDTIINKKQFTGTALVVHNHQLILQKGYGFANVAKNLPNTYQSLFQIGSIQKGLTAALVLQQVQAKKLRLDETINRFYPYIPDSQRITVRQLLSMRSGLYQKIKPKINMSDENFLLFAISNAAMSKYNKYRYDAINYYILVGILEQLTNQSYREMFEQLYNQKLHLAHTIFYSDFLHSNNRTYPYEHTTDQEITGKNLLFEQEVGTGNVGMTVSDLYFFYYNLFHNKLINQATRNALWSSDTQKGQYMGGLYNYPTYIRSHGTEEGYETICYFTKDSNNSVILFTNKHVKGNLLQELAKSIFQSIYRKKL